MSIAAVVVRWKGGDEVRACVASLLAHGGPALSEVVLVDSGSADGGAQELAAAFSEIKVLALSENRSFAWAAGCGVRATRAPQVLLLNPDTELCPGSLGLLLSYLEANPEVAGVVPLLEGFGGSSQHRWQLRRLPGVFRLATGRPGAPALSGALRPTAVAIEQPAAACWLLRRSVWEALGGLDPAFAPAWWEDVDFCARLRIGLGRDDFPARHGFRLLPQARLRHHGGASLAHLSDSAFLTIFNRNLLLYAARHRRRHLALIRSGLRLTLLARALLRPRQRRSYLQAFQTLAG